MKFYLACVAETVLSQGSKRLKIICVNSVIIIMLQMINIFYVIIANLLMTCILIKIRTFLGVD